MSARTIEALAGLVKATRSNRGLYVVVVLVVQSVLAATVVTTDGVPLTVSLVGFFVIMILVLLLATFRSPSAITEEEQKVVDEIALGTEDDLPISDTERQRWAGRWNCRWSYLATSERVRLYVDDTIEFKPDDIHGHSGVIRGTGTSPYDGGSTYEVFGRVSKRHMGLMFYEFKDRHLAGLHGVMILRLEEDGNVYGWWLGVAKEKSDAGGRFMWIPSARESEFEPREYDDPRQDPPARPSALTAPSIPEAPPSASPRSGVTE